MDNGNKLNFDDLNLVLRKPNYKQNLVLTKKITEKHLKEKNEKLNLIFEGNNKMLHNLKLVEKRCKSIIDKSKKRISQNFNENFEYINNDNSYPEKLNLESIILPSLENNKEKNNKISSINNQKLKYKKIEDTPFTLLANNINWFRIRQPQEFKQISVNTLLPNDGFTSVTNFSELKIFCLNNQKILEQDIKKFNKFKKLSPTFLFSKKMLEKIIKLRDIFLEFDKDLSRMLELNELEEMFESNGITVGLDELRNLFFRGKKINKNEQPCLNFYQLIEFAFNAENEILFELFIRNLKIIQQSKEKNSSVNLSLKKDDKQSFLPMSLNLLLDYFNKKGSIRAHYDEIDLSIERMDKTINNNLSGKNKDKDKASINISDILCNPLNSNDSKEKLVNILKMKKENVKNSESNDDNTFVIDEKINDENSKLFEKKSSLLKINDNSNSNSKSEDNSDSKSENNSKIKNTCSNFTIQNVISTESEKSNVITTEVIENNKAKANLIVTNLVNASAIAKRINNKSNLDYEEEINKLIDVEQVFSKFGDIINLLVGNKEINGQLSKRNKLKTISDHNSDEIINSLGNKNEKFIEYMKSLIGYYTVIYNEEDIDINDLNTKYDLNYNCFDDKFLFKTLTEENKKLETFYKRKILEFDKFCKFDSEENKKKIKTIDSNFSNYYNMSNNTVENINLTESNKNRKNQNINYKTDLENKNTSEKIDPYSIDDENNNSKLLKSKINIKSNSSININFDKGTKTNIVQDNDTLKMVNKSKKEIVDLLSSEISEINSMKRFFNFKEKRENLIHCKYSKQNNVDFIKRNIFEKINFKQDFNSANQIIKETKSKLKSMDYNYLNKNDNIETNLNREIYSSKHNFNDKGENKSNKNLLEMIKRKKKIIAIL